MGTERASAVVGCGGREQAARGVVGVAGARARPRVADGDRGGGTYPVHDGPRTATVGDGVTHAGGRPAPTPPPPPPAPPTPPLAAPAEPALEPSPVLGTAVEASYGPSAPLHIAADAPPPPWPA